MALQTITTIADTGSTDALFRTWGSGISAKLAALGFVQTADTGQINWTTATKPTVAATSAGYEIWRFADTLQSTAPIFFKLEYGSAAVNTPNLWITVGTATDGAGVIASSALFSPLVTTSSRQALGIAGTGAAGTSGNEYFWAESSGGGALGVLLWPSQADSTFAGYFFGIERFRNLDGTASGDGFMLYTSRGATGSVSGACTSQPVFMLAGVTQPSSSAAWPIFGTSATVASNIIGTTLYPLPLFTGAFSPRLYGPSQMLIGYPRSDMATAGNTFTLSHYGTNRTWLTAGSTSTTPGWVGTISGGVGWSFAMRGD